ncbi:VOC family protein [Paraburkholderia sp. RCC_158]|uniref:VOC family protein n=1 Tax=Paraburkholderia sp. RCC_158 TaxID=3239220 RepID=UPI003523BFA4
MPSVPGCTKLRPDRPISALPGYTTATFQKTVGLPTQRNSVHLDLKTPDLDSDTERPVALGAIVVEQFELPQIRYTTLTDPDDNKFHLVAE